MEASSVNNPPRVLIGETESDAAYFNRLLRTELPATAGFGRFGECCHMTHHFPPNVLDQCQNYHDHMVIAVHRDAASLLFPYTDHFDPTSWWTSGHIFNMLAIQLYPGAQVEYKQLRCLNDEHAAYPRKQIEAREQSLRALKSRLGALCYSALLARVDDRSTFEALVHKLPTEAFYKGNTIVSERYSMCSKPVPARTGEERGGGYGGGPDTGLSYWRGRYSWSDLCKDAIQPLLQMPASNASFMFRLLDEEAT